MEENQSVLPKGSKIIIEKPPSWIGVRHLQVTMLFLCLVFAYIIRVNISVAIVAMTDNTTSVNTGQPGQTFNWDMTTKGYILSAFFWGCFTMNLPAAVIGHSINNKWLLGVSFAIASILSLITPFMVTRGNATYIIIIRILQGFSQAFMMPMIHGILSKWAPPQERARFATYILGGLNFGAMIVLSFSGILAYSPWGWPSVFYFSGGLGLLWTILWLTLGANSPESHPFISVSERNFIMRSLPGAARDNVKIKIPWRDILTSGPVWAIALTHIGQNWGFWTILTVIPTYFHAALKFELKKDGFLTALPFFLMWVVSFPLSFLADKLIITGYTSVTASRKIWNSVALWGGAAALLGMAYSGQYVTLAIVLYTVAITINCCIYMGFDVNHLDLSPNFARILMGITNALSNIPAILAPIFVGQVIVDETNVHEWRIVFICSAMAFFLGNTAFIILGSGELQPWNDPAYNKAQHKGASEEESKLNMKTIGDYNDVK